MGNDLEVHLAGAKTPLPVSQHFPSKTGLHFPGVCFLQFTHSLYEMGRDSFFNFFFLIQVQFFY